MINLTLPENEGKVFKYRFGKKIMDKITAAINGNPELDEPGIAVTCPFDGANFTLKAKKVGDWPNYDDSSFGVPAKIKNIDDEEVQKAIFEGMSDLRPITAESEFKPLAELTTRFNKVMTQVPKVRAWKCLSPILTAGISMEI